MSWPRQVGQVTSAFIMHYDISEGWRFIRNTKRFGYTHGHSCRRVSHTTANHSPDLHLLLLSIINLSQSQLRPSPATAVNHQPEPITAQTFTCYCCQSSILANHSPDLHLLLLSIINLSQSQPRPSPATAVNHQSEPITAQLKPSPATAVNHQSEPITALLRSDA
ncbi:unnamed protein product [Leuciscus chuanchicus]